MPYEKTWNIAMKAFPALVKPPKESFYCPGMARKRGYQMDLMEWCLTPAEAELPCAYPDW